MGIDNAEPVFSWICPLGTADQTAYRIIISDNKAAIENTLGNIWDTGKVESTVSANIPYKGKALRSRTKYWWRCKNVGFRRGMKALSVRRLHLKQLCLTKRNGKRNG